MFLESCDHLQRGCSIASISQLWPTGNPVVGWDSGIRKPRGWLPFRRVWALKTMFTLTFWILVATLLQTLPFSSLKTLRIFFSARNPYKHQTPGPLQPGDLHKTSLSGLATSYQRLIHSASKRVRPSSSSSTSDSAKVRVAICLEGRGEQLAATWSSWPLGPLFFRLKSTIVFFESWCFFLESKVRNLKTCFNIWIKLHWITCLEIHWYWKDVNKIHQHTVPRQNYWGKSHHPFFLWVSPFFWGDGWPIAQI